MKTLKQIEREVLASHRRGEPWSDTWAAIRADVVALQPFDRLAFRRLYRHLFHLAMTGDPAGQEPPGSCAADWEVDDASGAMTR